MDKTTIRWPWFRSRAAKPSHPCSEQGLQPALLRSLHICHDLRAHHAVLLDKVLPAIVVDGSIGCSKAPASELYSHLHCLTPHLLKFKRTAGMLGRRKQV